MREVKIEPLTIDSFHPFGSFDMMVNPNIRTVHRGTPPIEFYRDMAQLNIGGAHLVSFSVCRVQKRPLIIDVTEMHSLTGEGILPLDNDVVIHVAPATKKDELPLDQIRVFKVPCGTFVALRPGVWHHAPMIVNGEYANTLIVLPERAYANDCIVVRLDESQTIKVVP